MGDVTSMFIVYLLVRKRVFLQCHFIVLLNTIVLPRQARDKHRENSTKDAFLQELWQWTGAETQPPPLFSRHLLLKYDHHLPGQALKKHIRNRLIQNTC